MFRLIHLKLRKHPQLGDIELYFSDATELEVTLKPYTSIIIGPNGTGKSFILRTIAEIFRQFKLYSITGLKNLNIPYNFDLKYKYENDEYEIITRNLIIYTNEGDRREYLFFRNRPENNVFKKEGTFGIIKTGFEILLNELKFPEKLIVNSQLPTDRFIYQKSNQSDFYQYLGIRSTSSTSSTKSAVRRTINS